MYDQNLGHYLLSLFSLLIQKTFSMSNMETSIHMFNMFVLVIFSFLLELTSATCPQDTITVPPGLESKWGCLLVAGLENQFADAEAVCVSNNGHLISVKNGFVNSFLSRTFP